MTQKAKTMTPEEMELREKYKALQPKGIQAEGQKILKLKAKYKTQLEKLEGKESSFAETKKVALRKKLAECELAVHVLAEMKANYIANRTKGLDGSDKTIAKMEALNEFTLDK